MLREILNIFRKKRIVSLNELSILLKTDESAIEGMLNQLAKKGYIKRLILKCNSCTSDCKICPYFSQKDFYEYIENKGS